MLYKAKFYIVIPTSLSKASLAIHKNMVLLLKNIIVTQLFYFNKCITSFLWSIGRIYYP